MASFLDVCRFNPTLGGTTDWTVLTAVTGYMTPASAGAVNGAIYRYRAESADLTQWEVGYGAYTVSGTVLARTTVLFNSLGTTAKVNFSVAPQVAVVLLAEDLGALQVGQIPGTATNDAANNGNIGEILSVAIPVGSEVSLTTNTAANITSISFSPGDWDVTGVIYFDPATTTTISTLEGSMSLVSATRDTTVGVFAQIGGPTAGFVTNGNYLPIVVLPTRRFSFSTTTSIFLVAFAVFGTSTIAGYGVLRARRVR